MLFFLDMEYGQASAVRELYGLAHLAFFMLMAMGISRLPFLARRPFVAQFFLVMGVVLLVGGTIELVQRRGDRGNCAS